MTNKKRKDALLSLAKDMNIEKESNKNIVTEKKTNFEQAKPKSRLTSNIPWYPKSAKLKKELKLLALHEDTTLTGLIDEGIKMVLAKRGKDIKDYL